MGTHTLEEIRGELEGIETVAVATSAGETPPPV